MCEILLIVLGCIQIGKMLRAKGHDPGMYQVMFVVAWIVGELGGGILGFIIAGGGRDAGPIALVFALMGVACGAGGVFFMASSVRARKTNYGSGSKNGGNNSNQVLFPPNLQDPYASPQYPQYPQPQYPPPPQYPPSPYQQPYPPQHYAPPPPPAPYPPPGFPPPQAAAPIRFSCPQGHVLEDESSAAGQQRSCPICSTNFIVPGPAIPTAKPVSPNAVRRPPQPPKR